MCNFFAATRLKVSQGKQLSLMVDISLKRALIKEPG